MEPEKKLKECISCGASVNRNNYSRHFQVCGKGLAREGKRDCSLCGQAISKSNFHRHEKTCKQKMHPSQSNFQSPVPVSSPRRGQEIQLPENTLAHLTLPIELPDLCSPDPNCIFAGNVDFLMKLGQHTKLAKPAEWLSLLPQHLTVQTLKSHFWYRRKDDYTLALEDSDLEHALGEGLSLPVLIPAGSPLAVQKLYLNDSSQNASEMTLRQLLDRALGNDLSVDVQDPAASDIENLTCLKSCGEVRERFAVPPEKRSIPWNCLEVADNLFSNFPGPSLLESLDFLERLQSDPNSAIDLTPGGWQGSIAPAGSWRTRAGMARKDHSASWVPGAKKLDRWLLISEEGAISKDHVDVVVATWIRCIRGEKIIWFQNGLTEVDLSVWKMSDYPCEYDNPWAALRLREGDTFIFPPGLIHVVYTAEDSICSGGHFLYPAIMDRAITMLKTLELKPYLTNDNIPVDMFKVIFGFTDKLLRYHPYEISPRQLARYVRALEDYGDAGTAHKSCWDKDHVKRKKIFLRWLKEERMLERLSKLVEHEGGLKRKQEPSPDDTASKRRVQSGNCDSGHHVNSIPAGIYQETNTSARPLVVEEASQEDKAPREVESLTLQGPTAKPNVVLQDSEDGKKILYHNVTIGPQDVERVKEEDGCLNDSLVSFYLWFLRDQRAQRQAPDYPVLSSFLIPTMMRDGPTTTEKWTKFDIYTHDFIIIPIHDEKRQHWYVAILCYPGSLLKDSSKDSPVPCLLNLDPLSIEQPDGERALRQYIEHEATRHGRMVDMEKMKVVSSELTIPRQKNNYDCGLFILAYCEKFLLDPPGFIREFVDGKKSKWRIESHQMRQRYVSLLERFEHSDEHDGKLVDRDGVAIIDGVLGPGGKGLMCVKKGSGSKARNSAVKP